MLERGGGRLLPESRNPGHIPAIQHYFSIRNPIPWLAGFVEIKDEPDSDGEGGTLQQSEIKKERKEEEEEAGEEGTHSKKEDGSWPAQETEEEKDDEQKEEDRVFSDNLRDMCLCECKLCGTSVYHHQIKSHNDSIHRPARSQYDFIRQTYYR